MTFLFVGLGAALAFPVAVLIVHRRQEIRRNRRACRRRTEHIRL